jgi:hypothetical protein
MSCRANQIPGTNLRGILCSINDCGQIRQKKNTARLIQIVQQEVQAQNRGKVEHAATLG